jgi:hypothetical protein
MTALARVVIDMLLTEEMQAQAALALNAKGLGDTCTPADYTGFVSWPTRSGTCTLIHSPAAMLLIAENRRESARLVGAAPYDAKAINGRNWEVFATPAEQQAAVA